jgi:hypothetical protein
MDADSSLSQPKVLRRFHMLAQQRRTDCPSTQERHQTYIDLF